MPRTRWRRDEDRGVATRERLLRGRHGGGLAREQHGRRVAAGARESRLGRGLPAVVLASVLGGDVLEPGAEGGDRVRSDDALAVRARPTTRRSSLPVARPRVPDRRLDRLRRRARCLLGREVDEVDDVARASRDPLRPSRAGGWPARPPRRSLRQPAARKRSRKPIRLARAPASRSAQSSSASSRPTESRSRPGRHAVALPPRPRLDAGADTAEARAFSISRVDVSTRRAASASATSKERRPPNPGIAHGDDRGVARGGASAIDRARLGLARHPHLERLEPAQEEPGGVGVGRRARCATGTRGGAARRSGACRRRRRGARRRGPARYFVAEWTTRSHPSSSGRTCSGVAAVASHTTCAGWALGRVRSPAWSGTDSSGASSQTRSAPSGGGARLVELDGLRRPSGASSAEHDARPVVRALCERDRVARREQREHDGRASRPCPRRTAAPLRRRARRAAARPPRSSGWRSAST